METKEDLALHAVKDFSVTVQRLYEGWINEYDLRKWWKPMGNELAQMENEVKEGGGISYVFQTTQKQHAFSITGIYKQVAPEKKLVYTWNWEIPNDSAQDSKFLLTILFRPSGEGSRIEITQENFKTEESIKPHREGWESALNNLSEYLAPA